VCSALEAVDQVLDLAVGLTGQHIVVVAAAAIVPRVGHPQSDWHLGVSSDRDALMIDARRPPEPGGRRGFVRAIRLNQEKGNPTRHSPCVIQAKNVYPPTDIHVTSACPNAWRPPGPRGSLWFCPSHQTQPLHLYRSEVGRP